MSSRKESVDVSSILLAQTSKTDYEELWRLEVLGLEDRPTNSKSIVRQGYHSVETILHCQTIELEAYVAWQVLQVDLIVPDWDVRITKFWRSKRQKELLKV
jgi:hypothetical protein